MSTFVNHKIKNAHRGWIISPLWLNAEPTIKPIVDSTYVRPWKYAQVNMGLSSPCGPISISFYIYANHRPREDEP